MASFKERMHELRTEKRLKKTDVAAGTGMDRSSITKYENGERDNPTRDILKKLADFFGVSMDYLSGNSDIRDKDVSSSKAAEIFGQLDDSRKIELIRYAKLLLEDMKNG